MVGTKAKNQWFVKVTAMEMKGNYSTIYFKCGEDEKNAIKKEQEIKKRFGNKVETEVYFGNLTNRVSFGG